MINLNEYDNVVTKSKNWIDPEFKRLYSNNIKRKPYFTILKKYDRTNDTSDYYLVMLDKLNEKFVCDETYITKTGTVKIPLNRFWDKLPIATIHEKVDVLIDLVEEDEHTIVYYLDI